MQLFSSMSSPSFLLANDSNHSLLHSLLEAMNAILEHQYKSESSLALQATKLELVHELTPRLQKTLPLYLRY